MAASRTTGRSGGGRVSKIQEVLGQIGQLDDDSATHREQAQAIFNELNEKHYRVIALGKPSDVQRTKLHMKRYIE